MKKFAFHPYLFGVYSILALYAHNIDQVKAQVILRPLIYSLLAVTLLLFILWALIKDLSRAALLCTLSVILFFSYGHVYSLLKEFDFGRHRFLFPLWSIIFVLLSLWILKRVHNPGRTMLVLNGIGLAVLLFPLIQITSYTVQLRGERSRPTLEVTFRSHLSQGSLPDIYHILLDEYARADVLGQVYGLDNAAFLGELTELGFYVAECSQSNYSQTELVLSSMLNLIYLDGLHEWAEGHDLNRPLIRRSIMGNEVMQALDEAGYQFVAFETGYPFSEFVTADYYFSPDENEIDLLSGLNNFEVLILKSTAALVLLDASRMLPNLLISQLDNPLEQKRELIVYDLLMLESLPSEIPGPKYVFVHILLPHEPFVFGAQGESVKYPAYLDEADYIAAYRDQVLFLNKHLIPVLTGILADSAKPPVIILQGDTGPGRVSPDRRMAILNALYLPGMNVEELYTTISPVNTYRLIFDLYFGSNLQLLDDISYYSTYDDPFTFKVIPNRSGRCGSLDSAIPVLFRASR